MYIYICVYIYICIYIYIHVYIYRETYNYIYIYIHIYCVCNVCLFRSVHPAGNTNDKCVDERAYHIPNQLGS